MSAVSTPSSKKIHYSKVSGSPDFEMIGGDCNIIGTDYIDLMGILLVQKL